MEHTTTNGVRNGGPSENGSAKRVKMNHSSIFDGLPVFPPDAIFHVKVSFNADKDPRKVNLGVGGELVNVTMPSVFNGTYLHGNL